MPLPGTPSSQPPQTLRDPRACPGCEIVGRCITGRQHFCQGCSTVYYATGRRPSLRPRGSRRDAAEPEASRDFNPLEFLVGLVCLGVAAFLLYAIFLQIEDGVAIGRRGPDVLAEERPGDFKIVILCQFLFVGVAGWLGWKMVTGTMR